MSTQPLHDQPEFEPSCEPLQRFAVTFELAPRWLHLKDAPIADFESCDTGPLTIIALPGTSQKSAASLPEAPLE